MPIDAKVKRIVCTFDFVKGEDLFDSGFPGNVTAKLAVDILQYHIDKHPDKTLYISQDPALTKVEVFYEE